MVDFIRYFFTDAPEIYYKEPIFRPPGEANSLLIQATEGCSYRCDFCLGNEGKTFRIRNLQDIKKDFDNALKIYGDKLRKVFLLDGNAFVMKTEQLIEISNYAVELFPRLQRVGAYSHAKDITVKSDEELAKIREAGIKILYVGIESGDDDLLKSVNKSCTAQDIIEASHKLYKAGITMHATIILGLAGSNEEASNQHAVKTAELINKIKPENNVPWYISALTLMLPCGTVLSDKKRIGEFHPLSNIGILKELKIFLENLDDNLEKCIFRTNHASNYINLESNNLARNRGRLVQEVEQAILNPDILKNECYRAL